jgi:hypothetical protein
VPKPKKPSRDMTTDEALEHVFGKRGAAHARKHAAKEAKPQVKRSKRSIKSKDK